MEYNKVLIGKNSPENRCFTEDGEWLIIAQDGHKMKGGLPIDHHFFVGINSKKPSRYGWVAEINEEIDENDLAKKVTNSPSLSLIESCKNLLTSVSAQKAGTPMACTYATTGILKKEKILKVHKVFFYKA